MHKIKVQFKAKVMHGLKKIPLAGGIYKRLIFQNSLRGDLPRYREERDPKDNARTTPPASEHVEIHCSWVSEVYTPSNIGKLPKLLKKLGWNDLRSGGLESDTLTDWVKRSRGYVRGGSWINGGIVTRKGDTRFFTERRYAKLPKEVDYARFYIYNLTPSLTMLVMQFVYNEIPSEKINSAYSRTYKTKLRYFPSYLKSSRVMYLGVDEQKKEAISKSIEQTHRSVYRWFKTYIPGYYSSIKGKDLPTVDLITSQQYKRPTREERTIHEHYIDMLFGSSTECWISEDDPGLELRLPWSDHDGVLATLFGNFKSLTKDMKYYGGKDRHSLTNKLDSHFRNNFALWAGHKLLISYEEEITSIRDQVIQEAGSSRSLKNLKFIKSNFSAISFDIQSVCKDMEKFLKSKGGYGKRDYMDFKPPHYIKDVYPNILKLLHDSDEERAAHLLELEERVNKNIISSGNLTSTIANLRLQRIVLWLTIVVALLTIATSAKSISELYEKNFKKDSMSQTTDKIK